MYRIGENAVEGLAHKPRRTILIKSVQEGAPQYDETERRDYESPKTPRIKEKTQRHPRHSRGSSLPTNMVTKVEEISSRTTERKLPPLTTKSKKAEDDTKSFTGKGLNESVATLSEIKRILDQTGKRKGASVTTKAEMRRVLVDDDYETVGPQLNREEDKEHVKTLDRWRMEIKRKKIMNSVDKMSEIMDSFRQKKAQENGTDPIVNVDALNRILVESDEDSDSDGGFNTNGFGKKGAINLNDDRFLKGIEIAILENNQELVNSFVMRKVQAQIDELEKKSISPHQLKLQIKLIVEGAMHKFKALKKYINEHFLMTQADMILQKLRIVQSKDTHIINQEEAPEIETDKTVVDYPIIESALLKNYHQTIDDQRNLAARKSQLNNETFKLKKEMTHIQHQLQQIAMKEKASQEVKSDTPKDGLRRAAVLDLEGTPDFMAQQKARLERKKQEAIFQEKMNELQQRLTPVTREIETVETNLKMARDTKAYFKMQLKDLYYKVLKDETYLLKNKTCAGSSWIIKSLWSIHEEIKDQAFPTFLSSHSIRFMTDYCKVQVEIEKYCIQNGLMGMLSGLDDFKHSLAISKNKDPDTQDYVEELTPRIFCEKTKTANYLLDEFRDKMSSMKKVNLRAKRLVNVVQFTAKGRTMVPKWEEVNPLMTNDEIINQMNLYRDAPPTEIEVSTPEPRNYKVETPIIIDPNNPANIVKNMLENLEIMKNNEVNKLIRDSVGLALDDRLKSNLERTFLFMLGKIQGPEAFKKFLKEKKAFDDKNMKSTQTHKRAHAQSYQISTNAAKILKSLMTTHIEKLVTEVKQEDLKPNTGGRSESMPKLPSISRNGGGERSPLFTTHSAFSRNDLTPSPQLNFNSSRILQKKNSKNF